MKKIVLIALMLVLVGCGANDKKEEKKGSKACDEGASSCTISEGADMSAYENFTDKNNQFIKSDMKEVLSLIDKKESAIVYFGFPDCPWCVEALPVLNEVAKEEKRDILYVQTRDDKGELTFSEEEKQTMMTHSDEFLDKDDNGEKKFYVPFVVVIKDGKVIAGHVSTVDGYDTSERKMNDSEKQELKNIYKEMFEK